ncbi:MAG: hypothetical protein ACLQPH_15410 [Acidimicrobiales bacterium]
MVQGTADTVVAYRDTTGFVTGTLCRDQHDTVAFEPVPGAGHTGVVSVATPLVLCWIASRLAGTVAPTSCARTHASSG